MPLVAVNTGETLAVDEDTENFHSGTFKLSVNWGDPNDEDNISTRIIDLMGVYGSTGDWFQHDSQNVGTIFLSGIDIEGAATAEFTSSAASVRFGYRASSAQEGSLAGAATISGKFVGNGQSEGPLGVLGTWSMTGTGTDAGLDFTGLFGADLKP